MRIMGVDPSTRLLGVGIIDDQLRYIHSECIDLRKEDRATIHGRIFREMLAIMQEYKPACLAIEDQFIGKNPQSAMKVIAACAATLTAAEINGLPCYKYSPCTVKKAACGKGNASKEYLALVVRSILGIPEQRYLDITDALAVAICHANRSRVEQLVEIQWK